MMSLESSMSIVDIYPIADSRVWGTRSLSGFGTIKGIRRDVGGSRSLRFEEVIGTSPNSQLIQISMVSILATESLLPWPSPVALTLLFIMRQIAIGRTLGLLSPATWSLTSSVL